MDEVDYHVRETVLDTSPSMTRLAPRARWKQNFATRSQLRPKRHRRASQINLLSVEDLQTLPKLQASFQTRRQGALEPSPTSLFYATIASKSVRQNPPLFSAQVSRHARRGLYQNEKEHTFALVFFQ